MTAHPRSLDYRRVFFFFQAEDGIRDYKVTGVQTCALPICGRRYSSGFWISRSEQSISQISSGCLHWLSWTTDRKSTRLNSSHLVISYAVFCLKKKNNSYNTSKMYYFLLVCTSFTRSIRCTS